MALTKVNTVYGTVVGVEDDKAPVTVFRGIPYAKPPVGALRFQPPGKPDAWTDERLCDRWGPPCIQYHRQRSAKGQPSAVNKDSLQQFEIPAGNEDCLYLNIWTPAKESSEKLPVMFWIYGGGFNGGWSVEPEFRGGKIAQKGVVLVSIAYRCGVLGFASHPALAARSETKASGNYGILDQIAALKWVRENIVFFGGDPGNVTVFGQSAGGMSCKYLLCSPLAKGLFRRAIVQSGGGLNAADPTKPSDRLGEITQKCLELLDWSVDDMLGREAQEVTQKIGDISDVATEGKEFHVFQPCVDGYSLTELPEKTIADGTYHQDIDIICGTVLGDSWMFSRKVRGQLQERQDLLRAFAYSPGETWGRHQVNTSRVPIRTYFFERDQGGGLTPHGNEIPYIFGTFGTRTFLDEPVDYELSQAMMSYWTNFARTGDPNGDELPEWPFFDSRHLTMHFTNDGIYAEDIGANPAAEHVVGYTEMHPGMIENLDDFWEYEVVKCCKNAEL